MDEEEKEKVIRGIRQDVDILYQAPETIRQASLVCEALPLKSKARSLIISQVKKLRKQLISLDVLCQDIEWSMSQRNLKQQTDFFNSFKFANSTTANT